MARRLSELRREIIAGDLSVEEWLQLDQEVNDAFANASEEAIQEFVDSGAGEMLDMIISGFKSMQTANR